MELIMSGPYPICRSNFSRLSILQLSTMALDMQTSTLRLQPLQGQSPSRRLLPFLLRITLAACSVALALTLAQCGSPLLPPQPLSADLSSRISLTRMQYLEVELTSPNPYTGMVGEQWELIQLEDGPLLADSFKAV